jgi:hypothetical protein
LTFVDDANNHVKAAAMKDAVINDTHRLLRFGRFLVSFLPTEETSKSFLKWQTEEMTES